MNMDLCRDHYVDGEVVNGMESDMDGKLWGFSLLSLLRGESPWLSDDVFVDNYNKVKNLDVDSSSKGKLQNAVSVLVA